MGELAKHKPGMVSQYLVFSLHGELFAVGTSGVREIIEYGHVTAVPMVPRFVKGVLNLRGAVVPVIDLGTRFGRADTVISRRTCIVILEITSAEDTHVLGVIVDAVSAVRQIDSAQIEPPPHFGTRIRAEFISGMAKVNDQFVILLEPGRVLSMDEVAVMASMSHADTADTPVDAHA